MDNNKQVSKRPKHKDVDHVQCMHACAHHSPLKLYRTNKTTAIVTWNKKIDEGHHSSGVLIKDCLKETG